MNGDTETTAYLSTITGPAGQSSSIKKTFRRDLPIFLAAAIDGNIKLVRSIVKQNDKSESVFNITDSKNRNALHIAVSAGQLEVLEYLAGLGAPFECGDHVGSTALHYASSMGYILCVKFLIQSGAPVMARDIAGRTSLHVAAGRGKLNCVKQLLSTAADAVSNTTMGERLHDCDKAGGTALHWASVKGHAEVVNLLLLRDEKAHKEGKRNVSTKRKGKKEKWRKKKLLNCLDNDGRTALTLAAGKGHIQVARRLLSTVDKILLLHSSDKDGATALHWSADKGHLEMTKFLLASGANLRAVDKTGRLALHWAADRGHLNVVKCLLEAATRKIGQSNRGDESKSFPRNLESKGSVASPDELKRLRNVTPKMDNNFSQEEAFKKMLMMTNDSGRCSLHLSCLSGHSKLTHWLLQNGAETGKSDAFGWTAAWRGHEVCSQHLLAAGSNPNARNNSGRSPAHLAASGGHVAVLNRLSAAGADIISEDGDGGNLLHWAAKKGHASVISFVLNKIDGLDIEAADDCGRSALTLASAEGHVEAVGLLLSHGADPCNRDEMLRVPLHHASEKGHLRVVEALLGSNDIDVNAKDRYNRTPLHLAAAKGRPNVVTLLLDAGARHEAKDKDGRTPLHAAARQNINKSANNLNLDDGVSGQIDVVQLLLRAGANIHAADKRNWTPTHFAAWVGRLPMLELLMRPGPRVSVRNKESREGAKLNSTTKLGRTPLHLAAAKGHAVAVNCLVKDRRFGTLNMQDEFGWTALHLAAANNSEPTIKCLYKAGADTKLCDKEGRTAFDLACEKNVNARVLKTMKAHNRAMETKHGETKVSKTSRNRNRRTQNEREAHKVDPDRDDGMDADEEDDDLLAFRRGKEGK
eukprot:g2665.t1